MFSLFSVLAIWNLNADTGDVKEFVVVHKKLMMLIINFFHKVFFTLGFFSHLAHLCALRRHWV